MNAILTLVYWVNHRDAENYTFNNSIFFVILARRNTPASMGDHVSNREVNIYHNKSMQIIWPTCQPCVLLTQEQEIRVEEKSSLWFSSSLNLKSADFAFVKNCFMPIIVAAIKARVPFWKVLKLIYFQNQPKVLKL